MRDYGYIRHRFLDTSKKEEPMDQGTFIVGDRVSIATTSQYHVGYDDMNPINVCGTITRTGMYEMDYHGLTIEVRWDNGMVNQYGEVDLLFIDRP
jgi:hypothetical protein